MEDLETQRHKALLRILQERGIGEIYGTWLRENTGSGNPYHNQEHQIIVALYAEKTARKYVKGHYLPTVLLLAGMYHDYNHTGNPNLPDWRNVDNAVAAWRSLTEKHIIISEKLKTDVERHIRATTDTYNPQTLSEEIIREADYAYLIEADREKWLTRLSEEIGIPVTEETTITYLSDKKFTHLQLNERV